VSDVDLDNPRQVTHQNPQFEKYKMGSARLIDWLSDDGEQLHGALLLPSDYRDGVRYPLVVVVYGGERLSDGFNRFGSWAAGTLNMQLLATRGYAILLPDSPQHPGTAMLDLAKTVLPGVNKVVEMGIADPDRLGVMGQSNGGYSTLALIVQTKRFKAAIDIDGMGDVLSDYGSMGKDGTAYGIGVLEHGQDAMGGTPWEFRERYIENSPFLYLDRVETPLLIVHGEADTTVPPSQSDEIFVGLRRLGKEVEYAKYEGEGHSPLYWTYAHQVDFVNRMIVWFNKYLKPAQPAN
jgi:dipeptidyl aminopeptidase/acylaminoacyl peptidase